MKTGDCNWLKSDEQKPLLKPSKISGVETVPKTNIPEICPHSGTLCDCGGHCGSNIVAENEIKQKKRKK